MNTIYASLPFYDSLDKQDRNRNGAIMPIHSPRHKLPPFLFKHDKAITKVELVNCNAVATNISSYFNIGDFLFPLTEWRNLGTYETFTSSKTVISSAINTTSTGSAVNPQGLTEEKFMVTAGDVVKVAVTLTLNSGQAPSIWLQDDVGVVVSNVVALNNGANTATLTVTKSGSDTFLAIQNSAAGNWATGAFTRTLNFGYIQYTGTTLKTLLPRGSYYVRLTDTSGNLFYSEYIFISDIYPNLISRWSNSGSSPYETFTSVGTTITSAINTSGDGSCWTNTFKIKNGESVTVIYKGILNSGTGANVFLSKELGGGTQSNTVVFQAGMNIITLTATETMADARLRLLNTATNTNFSTSEVLVIRQYSSKFIKLTFDNTNDLGDILYSTAFEQQVWLEANINTPSHEMIEVGEEKDGIFIAEKLVTKYLYKIIAYVSRALYRVLVRLPQHDSITIIDEVGNTYTPAVGNVSIEPIDWVTYETGKITIMFNDGGNTAFVWTKGMTNLI